MSQNALESLRISKLKHQDQTTKDRRGSGAKDCPPLFSDGARRHDAGLKVKLAGTMSWLMVAGTMSLTDNEVNNH